MAQKGQKQEEMSCGEVLAVCSFHTQGYCTIISTSGSILHRSCATHCMATLELVTAVALGL